MSEKQAVTEAKSATPKKASLFTRELISISLLNFAVFTGFNMTTTGMPVYVASLGASEVVTGLVTTLAITAALVLRPITGMVIDRYGGKGILIVSTAAMAAITVSFAVFPIIGIILALRLVQGIFWGFSTTGTSTIAADTVPRSRFAEGMGYYSLTVSLGMAIAPALAVALLQNSGIVVMVAVSVSFTLVAMILAIFLRAPKIAVSSEKIKLSASSLFEKRALFPSAIMILLNIGYAAIVTFIVLYGQARGVSDVYLFFIIYAITTVICRPIVGRIIDKVGFFIPGIVSTLAVAGTMVLISFSTNIVMFCLAGVLAGIGLGTGMGTLQTMAVAAVPSKRRGVATSTFLFGYDGGIALGAVVAGAIAGVVGYASMYLVIAVFPLLAFIIFLFVGKKRIARYSLSEEAEGEGPAGAAESTGSNDTEDSIR